MCVLATIPRGPIINQTGGGRGGGGGVHNTHPLDAVLVKQWSN